MIIGLKWFCGYLCDRKTIIKPMIMDKHFSTYYTTARWFKPVASLAVAALLSTSAYAQDAPTQPVNVKATQENGYVTLTWDRLAKADTLLTEGFEGDELPENWTVQTMNTYDKTFTWFHFPTPEQEETGDEEELDIWRHTGKGSAVVSWDQVGEHEDGSAADQDEWLIMPATKGAQYLNFYTLIAPEILEYGQYEDFPDHYYVKVSHDGGETWKAIWDARYDSNGSDDWQLVSLYLGDTSEGDAVVAFEARSDFDDPTMGLYFTWAIDDVSLYTSPVDAAAAATKPRHANHTLGALPAFRPFDTIGKKMAQPVRSAYKAQMAADTYRVLLDGEVIAENIKTTSYTDTSDKEPGEHVYGVASVNGDAISAPVEVNINVAAPLTNAPRNVSVVPTLDEATGKYKVLVSWEAPEGDRQPDHYEVFANDAMVAGWVDPAEFSVEQTGVNRGVQYYAVKAVYVNPDGESELVGDLVAMGTRNTPSNLSVAIAEGNATLAWNAPKASEYEVEKYQIFRGNQTVGETQTTSFTDENIPEGIYDYNVKAVYTDGFISLPATVSAAYGEEQVFTLPFAEDFTGGLKPAGWTIERVNTSMKTDYLWRFDNWYELPITGKGFDNDFASMTSSISPMVSMFAVLETPAISATLADGEKAFIEFDLDYCAVEKATGQKSNAGLRYSFNKEDWADVGDAFTGYAEEELADGETCKPQHITLDATDCFAKGLPVYFGWYYEARQAKHIAIDNVKIYKANGSGIASVEDTLDEGNAPVYSISGQHVADRLDGLAPGVYVQKGRKVVVK